MRLNLSNFFGPGSIFALEGVRHHDRRRLLAPALHGRSLKNHESIVIDETLRETANWPENKEFRILEPMHRITLNAILRTVFGADGAGTRGHYVRSSRATRNSDRSWRSLCRRRNSGRRLQSVEQVGQDPQGIRPHRIRAYRQSHSRSGTRRADGHFGAVAAQRAYRRNPDVTAGHLRRTCDPRRRRPRNHSISTELGV